MNERMNSIYQSRIGDPARLVHYLGRLLKDPRVPKEAKLKLAGGGLYAWIEGDIINDGFSFIPGVGWIDDIILVVHGVKCLIAETEPRVAVELWPGDEDSFRRTMTSVAWLDEQLYGNVRRAVTGLLNKVAGAVVGKVPAPQSK